MFSDTIWLWIAFNIFVLAMLALDLGVFHRADHTIEVKEALIWSGIWILIALAFNAGMFIFGGAQRGLEFFTGYLIERSLSIDNVFVFILLFTYFSVPGKYQYKVLFWGIIGALIMRGALIAVGASLVKEFHWIIFIFGAFLILSAIKMALQKETEVHPEQNPVVRLFKRFVPVLPSYREGSFFVKEKGLLFATPLFVVLLVVESTDLIFAIDSIPAIFAVTGDPFIVYTSNIFAILGLRAMYFALAGIVDRFHYLRFGLSAVLAFVGVKMLLTDIYKIPIWLSLALIAAILAISIVASLIRPREGGATHLANTTDPTL